MHRCLVEELAEETEEKFDEEACAKFFEEKKEELRKKADEMVHSICAGNSGIT